MNLPADKEIFSKQVEYLYEHLPVSLLAMVLNASILVYFFNDKVSPVVLWGWFAANLLLAVARLIILRAYKQALHGHERDRRYFLFFWAAIVMSGMLWGSTAFVLLPESSVAHQLFLVFVCGGMVAGAIGSSAVRPELYVTYQFLVMLPFIARFWSMEGELYVLMTLMLFLYMTMLLFFALRFFKTLSSTYRLTVTNSDLVAYLEKSKNSIEKLNRELYNEIEERTAAQEELRHALEAAKKANRAKDVFLASMSHELRTPLNAILGFSQILMIKKEVPAEVKSYIDKILLSGHSLLSLVNTILDFSKIEAGKMAYNPRKLSFDELMDEVLVMFEVASKGKCLEIIMNDRDDIELVADYQLLKQVMINLVTNAVKFSRKDGKIHIDCSVDMKGNCYRISVCDNGIGIKAEDLPTLFDPFTQNVSDGQENIKGTGLGLAISKQIVEGIHKGRIWAESENGKGSCFFVELPMDARVDACRL